MASALPLSAAVCTAVSDLLFLKSRWAPPPTSCSIRLRHRFTLVANVKGVSENKIYHKCIRKLPWHLLLNIDIDIAWGKIKVPIMWQNGGRDFSNIIYEKGAHHVLSKDLRFNIIDSVLSLSCSMSWQSHIYIKIVYFSCIALHCTSFSCKYCGFGL